MSDLHDMAGDTRTEFVPVPNLIGGVGRHGGVNGLSGDAVHNCVGLHHEVFSRDD